MVEPMSPAALQKHLEEIGLGQYIDKLVPLLKPSIGIVTHPVDEMTIPTGASKFGGSPDLPPSQEWPELYGYPLDFIAQIDLADVTTYNIEHHLPSSGILFFFHNESRLMANKNLWAKSKGTVLYYAGELAGLERRNAPQHQFYTACTLSFVQDATLPVYSDLIDDRIIEDMPKPQQDAYIAFHKNISMVSYKSSKANRMLGYPDHVQGSPLAEAKDIAAHETHYFKALSEINREWLLLLQIDSDENANMFFGDYGTLYFCILEEDLQLHRFDRTIVVSQST